MMRYAAYGLALVLGVVGIIAGIASGAGWLAGLAAGWLIDAILLIVLGRPAKIEGQPEDSFFAMFDVPPWLWIVCVVVLLAGGVVGFLIRH